MLLNQSFYKRKTLPVSQDLLGCFLVRQQGRRTIRAKIVETEAYSGPNDKASHAYSGITKRNAVMFGPPGVIYIYLVYGLHFMLNIVTGREGYPAAVLIRAVEFAGKNNEYFRRINGPARLTKAMRINQSFNALPVYTKKYGLWIESREKNIPLGYIQRAARVGVDYAQEYKDKKWRFYLK